MRSQETTLAIVLVALLTPIVMSAVVKVVDDPRCSTLESEARPVVEECKAKYDREEPIPLLRCMWGSLKKIDILAENAEVCRVKYPEDETELFCGLEILICSLQRLQEQCPSYKEDDDDDDDDDASNDVE